MDFKDTAEDAIFRADLRTWLHSKLPPDWGKSVFEPIDEQARYEFRLQWERCLFGGGWSGISWPKRFGGRGATLTEQGIFAEEMARARAPEGINIIGRNLVAPTLINHGTEAQQSRYLPKILSCDEVWCQGFSEPNAGSDLASIRCRADRDGDVFVVNGQKIWTSFAQYSQWCLLLVRTDSKAPKHRGISLLLAEMNSPGITVRPLRQISGESEFNETFFDSVRVPAENLVGELNNGWIIAQTTLAGERGPEDALARQIRFKQELERLLTSVSGLRRGEVSAIDESCLRQKLGAAITEVEIMRLMCLRSFSRYLKGKRPSAEVSMLKLYWSHAAQSLYEAALEILGPLAPLTEGDPLSVANGMFERSFLQSKAFTIYSGSSEIQRNIIAQRILGLPK